MVTTKKPKGITITIRDRKGNRSRTITVYGASLEEIFDKIKNSLK